MAQQARAAVRPAAGRNDGSRPSPRDLAVACGGMAVAAIAGVVGLAGGSLDLGPEITARLPAASQVLGAVALAAVVALPMTVAAVAGWRRSPWTAELGILAGTALIGWIAVEVAVIRSFSWLQPACALYGAGVLVLALALRRSSSGRRRS